MWRSGVAFAPPEGGSAWPSDSKIQGSSGSYLGAAAELFPRVSSVLPCFVLVLRVYFCVGTIEYALRMLNASILGAI